MRSINWINSVIAKTENKTTDTTDDKMSKLYEKMDNLSTTLDAICEKLDNAPTPTPTEPAEPNDGDGTKGG